METAIDVFINGIVGVFSGMTVVYITMRLITLLAGREAEKSNE